MTDRLPQRDRKRGGENEGRLKMETERRKKRKRRREQLEKTQEKWRVGTMC